MPKISIIIPVYNTEKYLEQCLGSLLNQTLKDIEIICIDDGSSDCSSAILELYKNKEDIVTVVSQKNKGASSARNRGIKLAKGEYIAFLDSDDFHENNEFYEILYNLAISNDADIVKANYKDFPSEYIPCFINDKIKESKFNFCATFTSCIFKRDFIIKNNIEFPLIKDMEDPVFAFHCATKANKIIVADNLYVTIRKRDGSLTSSIVDEEKFKDKIKGLKLLIELCENNDIPSESEGFVLGYWFSMVFIDSVRNNDFDMIKNVLNTLSHLAMKVKNDEFLSYINTYAPGFYTYINSTKFQPLISIVLPTYNGEKHIKNSIESVIGQTYKNWELIIVNDCSTDKTLDICNEYSKKDKRIRVISNPVNKNLPSSLNVGFNNAKGAYYTWTSDDNMFKENALEKMLYYLTVNPWYDFVSYAFDYISDDGKYIKTEFHDWDRDISNLLRGCNVGACFMYKKEVKDKAGDYDTDTFCAEDYDYWCRVALCSNISYVRESLYLYRDNPLSLTATKKAVVDEKTLKIRLKYFDALSKKCGFSKKAQVKKLLEFYFNEKNIEWLIMALKKNVLLTMKYLLKRFIGLIFSIRNCGNKKILRILGLKISLKRKRKNKNKQKIDYLKYYNLAKSWIEKYTVNNQGIVINSLDPNKIYPEVTGYYIPTLLKFGDRKRAKNFGDYLVSIQNQDGSWSEPEGKYSYTFDTGMILKGLVALVENNLDENDKYKNSLIKGADWIVSRQRKDGSISTPEYSWWNLPYDKKVPEAIHIYALEPLMKLSKMFGIKKYDNVIKKALDFYLSDETLTDFNTLSHFNAYIIEGLIDLGEIKRAKRAMDLISLHQRHDGSVPAYSFVDFVCSTGLLQYAICWYKLGEIEKADKAFDYVCKLQNPSGGWYGSYGKDANYFPNAEISWAVKYFLDAIYYRQNTKYEAIQWSDMWNQINEDDERYQVIKEEIKKNNYNKILDLGCGKARYAKRLIKDFPDKNFYCIDISKNNLDEIKIPVEKKQGTILNIPFENNYFDCAYLCESLEHCIDLNNAMNEISRVAKNVIIIDKDKTHSEGGGGGLELADFEQWFYKNELLKLMEKTGFDNSIVKTNLKYDNGFQDNLFNAWIGKKNKEINV